MEYSRFIDSQAKCYSGHDNLCFVPHPAFVNIPLLCGIDTVDTVTEQKSVSENAAATLFGSVFLELTRCGRIPQ
jgi:hypothetical protein